MSDVGRYRCIYPRLWRHPGFIGLTKSARELALYLLTGPQSNRLGLFYLSVQQAAEDLNVGLETLRKGLADVSLTFGWHFDSKARVFYIPSWWKWNAPANSNVLKGNLRDLSEIPPSSLADAFAANLQTLDPTLHETFVEGCRIRLPKHSPIQEQYQEAFQDREQSPARRAKAAKNGTQIDGPVLKVARLAVEYGTSTTPIEELFDIFNDCRKHDPVLSTQDVKRSDAYAALNVAIAERRAGVVQ